MKTDELREVMNRKNIDACIFYNMNASFTDPNFFYFSNYSGIGCLVVPKKSKPFLLVPKMEFERASKGSIKKVYILNKKRFFELINDVIKKSKIRIKTMGIDKNNVSLNIFSNIKKSLKNKKYKDVSKDCIALRKYKTEEEVDSIRKACRFTDRIFYDCIKNFREFWTEADVAGFLEFETKKCGLEPSFKPIVASGSNASMPHYEPKKTKLKKGFCVVDFGVKYNGYCSDMTRTIYIGNPSKKEIELYELLLGVQEKTIEKINYTKKCSEIYDFVNKELGRYKKYFTHGLGHGIGVEIHELPNLTLNSKDKIEDNMIFTIEPGIYFPRRFGIRIEDTVLFERNKAKILTKTTKDLLII